MYYDTQFCSVQDFSEVDGRTTLFVLHRLEIDFFFSYRKMKQMYALGGRWLSGGSDSHLSGTMKPQHEKSCLSTVLSFPTI